MTRPHPTDARAANVSRDAKPGRSTFAGSSSAGRAPSSNDSRGVAARDGRATGLTHHIQQPFRPWLGRSLSIIALGLLTLTACEPEEERLTAQQALEIEAMQRAVLATSSKALDRQAILERALVAAMQRANDAEVELEEVRAYCPRTPL